MRIAKIFDKGLGMLVGALTGLVLPLWQFALAYALFARWMSSKYPNLNWPIIALATATIGTIPALLTAVVSFCCLAVAPFYGMRVGFREGFRAALKLPGSLFERIYKNIIFQCTDSTTFAWKADQSRRQFIFQFIWLGAFSLVELVQGAFRGNAFEQTKERLLESLHQNFFASRHSETAALAAETQRLSAELDVMLQAGTILQARATENQGINRGLDAESIQRENQVIAAAHAIWSRRQRFRRPLNAALLASFEPPKPLQELKNNLGVTLLNEHEIEQFRNAILALPEITREEYQKNLNDYLDAIRCPITLETISDPVIVIVQNGKEKVYQNSGLRDWIEQQDSMSIDAKDPVSQIPLTAESSVVGSIRNGYPDAVLHFVSVARQLISEDLTQNSRTKESITPKPPKEIHESAFVRIARLKRFGLVNNQPAAARDPGSTAVAVQKKKR